MKRTSARTNLVYSVFSTPSGTLRKILVNVTSAKLKNDQQVENYPVSFDIWEIGRMAYEPRDSSSSFL